MISVIVPVYKVELYLRQCIDSILAQTYTDFELILVDDGSPDNCGAICDEYAQADSRVRVIHQENRGISAARNAGIDTAKGEFLTFIDSDDLVLDTYLERLLDTLLTQQADISGCGMISFVDGTEIAFEECTKGAVEVMRGRDACLSIYRMDGKVAVMAWGKLYRTKLFRTIRYPVGRIHEDDATTPRVLYTAQSVALSPNQLYLYRQRLGSIMNTEFSIKRFDGIYAIDSCIVFLQEKNDNELVEAARQAKLVVQSKLVVRAYAAGIQDQIPKEFRISEWRALSIIRRWSNDDIYSWFLSLNHPKLIKPHSYVRKLKEILKLR